jgi:hypothetical protein
MSDDYESNAPDFTQILQQRLASKPSEAKPSPNGFDPYKAMLNKKKSEDGEPIDTTNTVKWTDKEMDALKDFCQKNGILGFNCGHMSPIAALAMLKNKLGIVDGPLEERVPYGYQMLNSSKKTLLKG